MSCGGASLVAPAECVFEVAGVVFQFTGADSRGAQATDLLPQLAGVASLRTGYVEVRLCIPGSDFAVLLPIRLRAAVRGVQMGGEVVGLVSGDHG